jgi:hypothetical protein
MDRVAIFGEPPVHLVNRCTEVQATRPEMAVTTTLKKLTEAANTGWLPPPSLRLYYNSLLSPYLYGFGVAHDSFNLI